MEKMTGVMLICWLFVYCSPSGGVEPQGGQLVTLSISAHSLENNLFEDISEQTVTIYLPPGYDTSGRRYPVVYFLHGFSTPPENYFNGTFQGLRLNKSLDTLITNGTISEFIVVVPSARTFMLGSFYVDSEVRGNWEEYMTGELVNAVDTTYRTLAEPQSRGISGHSMGGFGAIHLAMKHPEIFGVLCALNPGLYNPDGLGETFMFKDPDTIESYLAKQQQLNQLSYEEAMTEFKNYIANNSSDTHLVFTYAYGAAFSPNPYIHPPFIDYPYTRSQGKIVRVPENWQRYENGYGGLDWKIMLYNGNLARLRAIQVEYGLDDEYSWIPEGCVYFSQKLTEAGVNHELIAFPGGHSDHLRERIEKSLLPFFTENLTF